LTDNEAQLWQLDHLTELRRRYSELERLAGEAALDVDRALRDEMELGPSSYRAPADEGYFGMMDDDVEEAALLEQMELDELMELRRDEGVRAGSGAVAEYEADEYDDIFMEFISEHPEVDHTQAHHLSMDLSNS
jgi:hypothetical protein